MHTTRHVWSVIADCSVRLSLQCSSSKAAEHRHDDLHWQHKGPGLQEQGSAFHSTLLSAYPFTTWLVVQLVATSSEKWLFTKLSCTLFLKSHTVHYPFVVEYYDHMLSFNCTGLFLLLFSVDILLNRSQQLFASCTAKFADGQQCSIPVFDITHQTPLCEEHAKKMVSSLSVI